MTLTDLVISQIDSIRAETGLSYNAMADSMNECLDPPVSSAAIFKWHAGQLPRIDTLAALVSAYHEGDWRGDFARSVLRYALGDEGLS
jgi:hypothetical protein